MTLVMLLLSGLGAASQNTIAIGSAEMEYLSLGLSVNVGVTMENSDEIVAAEITVKLPRGCSSEETSCQMLASRADGHQTSVS